MRRILSLWYIPTYRYWLLIWKLKHCPFILCYTLKYVISSLFWEKVVERRGSCRPTELLGHLTAIHLKCCILCSVWCGLKRLVHCVWDGWIMIAVQRQCETSVWTEWIPFVDLVSGFYLSLCSRLVSHTRVISVCCSHSPSTAVITLQPTFQPFCFLSLFWYFFSLITHWVSCRGRRNSEGRVRLQLSKKEGWHDSWTAASPANRSVTGVTVLPLSSYTTSQCIFQKTLLSHFSICTGHADMRDFLFHEWVVVPECSRGRV